MATQARGVIRDATSENREIPAGGKANMLKPHNKGGLNQRKPLGEISNSVQQPTLNRTKQKLSSMDFSYIKEETGLSNRGKKISTKSQEKAQPSMRKPLGDISNSRKLSTDQALKKSSNQILDYILEERFLHDHQECIKARKKAFDMDYFLKMVALDKDPSMRLSSQTAINAPLSLKIGSPLKYMEVDENQVDVLFKDRSPQGKKTMLLAQFESSPPPCKSPNSSNLEWNISDEHFLDFTLIDSPKASLKI